MIPLFLDMSCTRTDRRLPEPRWNGIVSIRLTEFCPGQYIQIRRIIYRIDNPMVGRGLLSASKVSEGFPNAELRIYGKFAKTGYPSIKELDLRPGEALYYQDLHFGAPDAILSLRVVDDRSSKPIKAQVTIGLPDDPNPMLTDTIIEGDVFEFVIPKRAITFRVSTPGYLDWAYRDKGTGRNALSAPVGTRIDLVAALSAR